MNTVSGVVRFVGAALLIATAPLQAQSDAEAGNPLLYALAWKQTAAEYQALYHQGFNIARLHVQNAIERRQPGDRPLAVISDVDDTLVHVLSYWGYLVTQGMDFFDDPIWDTWIPENLMTAAPGALDFLRFCADNDVAVFYVTSRDQGEQTFEFALGNLQHLGFPLSDTSQLTVLRESSNKEIRQDEIRQDYEVVVMLGDNLNDFRRKYYLRDVDARIAAMEEDRDKFGIEYVLFPNPTDGHWMAAIFGESEPPPTAQNRALLQRAAAGAPWSGRSSGADAGN